MSVFKVGQRVKKIGYEDCAYPGRFPVVPMGAEGTIFREATWGMPVNHDRCELVVGVMYDGYDSGYNDGGYSASPHNLAPLTDPKADAFIESVKKWKPEPVAPALPAKVKA